MAWLRLTNLDYCIQKLSAVGDATYELKTFLANSMWYGVPQSRTRVYILGVRSDCIGVSGAQQILQTTLIHLKEMNFEAPGVEP